MEAPNIQLYNLFRHDLRLSNSKSLEFMNILDMEYKSGVKEDLSTLEEKLKEAFLKVDARFATIDARFANIDARFVKVDAQFANIDARFALQDERLNALDKKLDVKIGDLRGDLRTEIHSAKSETNRYILGLFLAILLSFIALFFKK